MRDNLEGKISEWGSVDSLIMITQSVKTAGLQPMVQKFNHVSIGSAFLIWPGWISAWISMPDRIILEKQI